MVQGVHLSIGLVNAAGVVDNRISNSEAFRAAGLSVQYLLCRCPVDGVALHESLDLHGFRYVNNHNAVEIVLLVCFHQQWNRVNDVRRVLRCELGQSSGGSGANAWVQNCIQTLPCVRVVEDTLSERCTIKLKAFIQDTRPKLCNHSRQTLTANVDDLARDQVRIDNGYAMMRKAIRYQRLAAGNAPGQSDTKHTRKLESADDSIVPVGQALTPQHRNEAGGGKVGAKRDRYALVAAGDRDQGQPDNGTNER